MYFEILKFFGEKRWPTLFLVLGGLIWLYNSWRKKRKLQVDAGTTETLNQAEDYGHMFAQDYPDELETRENSQNKDIEQLQMLRRGDRNSSWRDRDFMVSETQPRKSQRIL